MVAVSLVHSGVASLLNLFFHTRSRSKARVRSKMDHIPTFNIDH